MKYFPMVVSLLMVAPLLHAQSVATPNTVFHDVRYATAPVQFTPTAVDSALPDPTQVTDSKPASSQAKPETAGTETAPVDSNSASPIDADSSVDPGTYVIGPGDALQVTVWKEPDLSGLMTVRPDGKISLVLLGDVPAAGLTPMALSQKISAGLLKYIHDPNVYILVTAANSHRVYLIGEVAHVGPVMLASHMTPLEAIATAGGLTMYANVKHIYVLRVTDGKQQKIPFNYKRALKGDNSQELSLLPGDTIVVP